MGALLQNIDKVECNEGKVAINCILEAYFVKLFHFPKGLVLVRKPGRKFNFMAKFQGVCSGF